MENTENVDEIEEEIRRLQEQTRLLLERKKQLLASKKNESDDKSPPISGEATKKPNQSLDESSINRVTKNEDVARYFTTYDKRSGTLDSGKEYEYITCALFALKLCAKDAINDFSLTSNNLVFGDFDDVCVTATFADQTAQTFLLQLKHKENKKNITNAHLAGDAQGDFSLLKYMTSFEKIENIDRTVCVLFTNAGTKIRHGAKFLIPTDTKPDAFSVVVSENRDPKMIDLLTNKDTASSLFQFSIAEKGDSFKRIQRFSKQFYFFPSQAGLGGVKSAVAKLLKQFLQADVYDSFAFFMRTWWAGNFHMTKHDIVAKLVELGLSPWTRTLNGDKCSERSQSIKKAIMSFEVTLVGHDAEKVVEKIWDNIPESNDSSDKWVGLVRRKYVLGSDELSWKHKSIAFWYLEAVPLIVEVNSTNQNVVISLVHLLKKCKHNKKIVLIGDVGSEQFSDLSVFENLTDLLENDETRTEYDYMVNKYGVSVQGRAEVALVRILDADQNVTRSVTTDELLKMSQRVLEIGRSEDNLPEIYVPRAVSSIYLQTEDTLKECLRCDDCFAIVNCDDCFKSPNPSKTMELSDYLNESDEEQKREKRILLSSSSKCTNQQFEEICQKHETFDVYLLQVINKESLRLVQKNGNKLELDYLRCDHSVDETDIMNSFDNFLNVLTAPPGMGKSTLLRTMSINSPPDFWTLRINLIDWKSFLETQHDVEDLLTSFLELDHVDFEGQVKTNCLETKKMHIFLDGLDEVSRTQQETVLSFASAVSSVGIKVWISSRDSLKQWIMESSKIVPVEIEELTMTQQEEYIRKRLAVAYTSLETEQIIEAIFASTDVNNSHNLLGIPLQLYIITENFLNDHQLYTKLSTENIFILTAMYRMFFEGKKKFAHEKMHMKESPYEFDQYLSLYEIPALRSCLGSEGFAMLGLVDVSRAFVDAIKWNGDRFGIIRRINDDEAVFTHQTYAEYFGCVWFVKNLDKVKLLRGVIFDERYANLKLMLDVMLAEKNPLHLAVIYRNVEQIKQMQGLSSSVDAGGRNVLHLVCSYGSRFPYSTIYYSLIQRESAVYQEIVELLLVFCQQIIFDLDSLFGLHSVQYSLESQCLYPLEVMLKSQRVCLGEVLDVVTEYYKNYNLAFYASQVGFANLLSQILTIDPGLLSKASTFLSLVVSESNNVKGGSIECIDVLLQHGVDINTKLTEEDQILDKACVNRRYDMIKPLLERGASSSKDINVLFTFAGYTTLNDAALQLCKELAIDVNARDADGRTALHEACDRASLASVQKLKQFGAKFDVVDNRKMNALHCVGKSLKYSSTLVDFLIANGVDINGRNTKGATPLHLFCRKWDIQSVSKLLEAGARTDITDNDDRTPLHYVTFGIRDVREMLELLNGSGVPLNAKDKNGRTVLMNACEDVDCVAKLLEMGAESDVVDNNGMNLLHYAAERVWEAPQLIDMFKHLEVNAQNRNGVAPLHLAFKNDTGNAVKLLELCADINVVDARGRGVVHYAAVSMRSRNLVFVLDTTDFGVDVRDGKGATALHVASRCGDPRSVKVLLERGASVKALDNDNKTVLFYAILARRLKEETIKLLIDAGVDVLANDSKGRNVLDFAVEKRRFRGVKLLMETKAFDAVPCTVTLFYFCVYSGCTYGLQHCLETLHLDDIDVNNEEFPLDFVSPNGHLNNDLVKGLTQFAQGLIQSCFYIDSVYSSQQLIDYLKQQLKGVSADKVFGCPERIGAVAKLAVSNHSSVATHPGIDPIDEDFYYNKNEKHFRLP